MTFLPGTRFGPYEVTAILGAGGMGEVYRARDARLARDVALKVLPPALTGDADRLLRFKREAQVLASLNHHNIAAIYGVEEGQPAGSDRRVEALVLELVEGPTLAERIAVGPLPLDEARAIGMQIAAALEAAHERGIVHRDLKPANVKLRRDGTVKVLDFGLAKAFEPLSAEHIDVRASPTFTSPAMTGAGIILGTAAYMSPEQARGAPVDKRTDVWAFGCVLFEMLAGGHVFGGAATVSDAIAAVLKSEPDWQALPETTPPHVRALLKRCLEKDPRHRLRDIGDAGLLLGETSIISEAAGSLPHATRSPAPATWITWAAVAGWVVAATLAIVSTYWIANGLRSVTPPAAAPLRLALPLPLAAQAMAANQLRSFAISRDGTRFVFLGRDGTGSSLYLQDLVSGELKRLAETADAYAPVFSPDGRAIAFISRSTLKVLRLDGGLPRDIAQPEPGREHWAWSGPDHVVIAGSGGLSRVAINGGSPELVAKLGPGEALFSSAFALPGGAYLVSARATLGTDDLSRVVVIVPGESERLVIADRGGSPTFVAGDDPSVGHVVYAESGRLMALPFDAARRIVKGSAVPIVESVAMRGNGDLADYTVSTTGTLVFREGSQHELVSIERGSGAVRPLTPNLRRFALPRLSPDGKRLAMEIQDSPHQIWMLDLERDVLVPLTTESTGSHNFAWAPDGSAIMYTLHVTPPQVGWIRTDGSGTARKIAVAATSRVFVHHWGRNGRLALRFEGAEDTVMTVRLDGATPPTSAGSPAKVADGIPGSFSPDGSWLAYCDCGASGSRPANVFIQHLDSGTRHQVSTDGGTEPVWATSGREVFFRAGSKMMAAQVAFAGTSVRIGRPQTIFEGDYLEWSGANYDVTSDGKQFIMVRTANANTRTLSVRLNWKTELDRLAPIQP